MAGIFIICFVAFPMAVFIDIHKASLSNEFLDRQDSDVIKGIATSFVILAHLTDYLESASGYNKLLSIFTVMGGMGVLLFFFLSGYGLYKGYANRKIDKVFWKNRLINMYLPCVFIQLVFYLIRALINQKFHILNLIIESFFGAWFIDVILIQYFIFFVTWKCAKGKPQLWITFSFLISMVIAIIFWVFGSNARWYNGLMLFPFGMLIAYVEKKLIVLIKNRWSLWFVSSIVLFGVSGAVFTYFKGDLTGIDVVKTFSGMCLSLMVCSLFLRIKLCSGIMQYIGRKSLYFYLVHINLMSVIASNEMLEGSPFFYIILILTFPAVEIFYRIHNRINMKKF